MAKMGGSLSGCREMGIRVRVNKIRIRVTVMIRD